MRAVACCRAYGFNRFARICGDRPFLPWELIETLVEMAEEQDLDLASNILERTYPSGTATEIVATRAIRRVVELSEDEEDREHVTRYIYAHPANFRIVGLRSGRPGWERFNLSLDDLSDVERTECIMARLGPRPECAPLDQVISVAARCNALAKKGNLA
jgi:spore coat polysaccharide biosynthesis protein SpsF